MAQWINHTDRIPNIPMPILMRNSNGSKIIIDAIQESPSVNFTVNFALTKVIPGIPVLYIGFIAALVIPVMPPSTKNKRKPKPYDTPLAPGIKWKMDVKYVPASCYTGSVPQKFYQYTVIDEATRQHFIYPYMEQSSYSTVDFLKRAIAYFGYQPKILQTDNGSEFTHTKKTDRTHPLDVKCIELGIEHKRIRPRTPWHNGKVERSHRNDQERFYNHMSFYSYNDLLFQTERYLKRSNTIPMQILGWKSPFEKRQEFKI